MSDSYPPKTDSLENDFTNQNPFDEVSEFFNFEDDEETDPSMMIVSEKVPNQQVHYQSKEEVGGIGGSSANPFDGSSSSSKRNTSITV